MMTGAAPPHFVAESENEGRMQLTHSSWDAGNDFESEDSVRGQVGSWSLLNPCNPSKDEGGGRQSLGLSALRRHLQFESFVGPEARVALIGDEPDWQAPSFDIPKRQAPEDSKDSIGLCEEGTLTEAQLRWREQMEIDRVFEAAKRERDMHVKELRLRRSIDDKQLQLLSKIGYGRGRTEDMDWLGLVEKRREGLLFAEKVACCSNLLKFGWAEPQSSEKAAESVHRGLSGSRQPSAKAAVKKRWNHDFSAFLRKEWVPSSFGTPCTPRSCPQTKLLPSPNGDSPHCSSETKATHVFHLFALHFCPPPFSNVGFGFSMVAKTEKEFTNDKNAAMLITCHTVDSHGSMGMDEDSTSSKLGSDKVVCCPCSKESACATVFYAPRWTRHFSSLSLPRISTLVPFHDRCGRLSM